MRTVTELVTTSDGRAASAKPLDCTGCTACCVRDTIPLTRKDDPSRYRTTVENGEVVLQKKLNGNCVYLTEEGCSIYDDRPWYCRNFDCRRYLAISEGERQYRANADPSKWAAIFKAAERHG